MTVYTSSLQSLLEEVDKKEEFSSLEEQGFPITDAEDTKILLHRDAHFSGSFKEMLNYYHKGGKGISAEFEIERIEYLADLEQKMQQNLAGLAFSGAEAEEVAQAKTAYEKLREIYEIEGEVNDHPRLIADLILAEEDPPTEAMEAIIAKGDKIVPSLIQLFTLDSFFDPLFPGYGQAPALAAKCLGEIGNERAIIPLFESIGRRDFFTEDMVLKALKQIGEPAKEFLMQRISSSPPTEDNERAAMVLIEFEKDPKVAKTCLQMIQEDGFVSQYPLSNYLALLCEGLVEQEDQWLFMSLANDKSLPKLLRGDMKTVGKGWR